MDWQTRATSYMQPTLPNLPKPTKALFNHLFNGNDKGSKAELVRCQKCYLTVHKICYGFNENMGMSWLCDRCQSNSLFAVSVL